MTAAIQWHVNCDVPGFRTLSHSLDGVAWTPVTVSGWLPFGDYVDAFAAALTASTGDTWTASVSTAGLVTLATDDDPRYLRFESQSMADLLGFPYEDTAQSDSHTSSTTAGGYVPTKAARWESPEPAIESHLTEYRHSRFFAAPWGTGAVYEVSCPMSGASAELLLSGPCARGKVRVGDTAAAAAMTSAATGGYLDGYVVDIRRPERMDNRQAVYVVKLRLLLPAAADRDTSSEDLGDAVFGSLKRGYSTVYSLTIEGQEPQFIETTLGLATTPANRTESPTLVIDSSGSIGCLVDRQKGIASSNPLVFGILDPENALGYWATPTEKYSLAEDVGIADDEVAVNESLSGVASSGRLHLGKELLDYDGVDTGSLPHRFTDITRGVYGPLYAYRAAGPHTFTTVEDVPEAWEGRIVCLWAHLVDPYGRAVGTTTTDDYSIQVFLGAIASKPRWRRGAWGFTAHTLERRFDGKIGWESMAQLDGRATDDAGDIYVWVDSSTPYYHLNGHIEGEAEWKYSNRPIISGASRRLTLRQVVNTVLADAKSLLVDSLTNPVAEALYASEYVQNDDGTVTVQVYAQASAGAGFRGRVTGGPTTPPFLSEVEFWMPAGESGYIEWILRPGAPQPATSSSPLLWSAFVREPQQEDIGTSAIPSSGYVTIEAEDTVELTKVWSKTALSEPGGIVYRVALSVRTEGGTPHADLTQRDRKVSGAQYLNDTPGKLALTLMESSGYALRGDYDTLAAGWGYGIPDDYIDETSFEAAQFWVSMPRIILAEPISLEKLLGGLFATYNFAVAQVRVGRALKVGLVSTVPSEGPYDHLVTDASLMLRDAVDTEDQKSGPNVVIINGATAALGGKERKDKVIVRLTESVHARGAVEWTFELRGLEAAVFYSVAGVLARAIAQRAQQQLVLRLRLAPWVDVLAGQMLRVQITHPDVYDMKNQALGFDGWARVLGVSRDPRTGIPEVVALADGQVVQGVLCPALLVTGVSGATLTLAEDPRDHFVAGETARLYNPGESGEHEYGTISSMTATTMVLSGSPSGWVAPNVTYVTYPDQGDGSTEQDAFVHVDDGSTWE